MKKVLAAIISVMMFTGTLSGALGADRESPFDVKVEGTKVTVSPAEGDENAIGVNLTDYNIDGNSKVDTLIVEEGVKRIWISSPTYVKDVYLPSTLEEWNGEAVVNFHVDENNPYLKDIDGALFSRDGKTLVKYGSGREDKSYEIPDGTEIIAARAFDTNIYTEEIIAPESLKRVEKFGQCQALKNFDLPEGLEHIEIGSLDSCDWYRNGDMRVVGKGILIGPCKESDFVTPPGCTEIADGAFIGKVFDSITIGGSVKKIGSEAFSSAHTDKLVIGEGVEEIGNRAFEGMGGRNYGEWVQSAYIPESIEKFGDYAFSRAAVDKLYLPGKFDETNLRYGIDDLTFASIYTERGSKTQEYLSGRGFLVFDAETEDAILPKNSDLKVTHISEADLTDGLFGQFGEPIEFEDKKPFIARGDTYVPLRFMCDMYGIDIVWNEKLGVAEVGARKSGLTRSENSALFGDNSLVVYDGEILPPVTMYPEAIEEQSLIKGKNAHSAINIDGCVYVPICDFFDATGAAVKVRSFLYATRPIIVDYDA